MALLLIKPRAFFFEVLYRLTRQAQRTLPEPVAEEVEALADPAYEGLVRVLLHRQLLQSVWGPEYGEETEYLRTFVKQLRRKLEVDPSRPRHLRTEPGVGYRLVTS